MSHDQPLIPLFVHVQTSVSPSMRFPSGAPEGSNLVAGHSEIQARHEPEKLNCLAHPDTAEASTKTANNRTAILWIAIERKHEMWLGASPPLDPPGETEG